MKILYVVPGLESSGGIQQFAKAQFNSLAKRHAITMTDWASPIRLREDIFLRHMPARLGRKAYDYLYDKHPHQVINPSEYDIVHFWEISAAMANPVPNAIITCHGLDILEENIYPYQRALFLETLQRAITITVPSVFTKNYLTNHYPIDTAKVQVIHPGSERRAVLHEHVQPKDGVVTIGTITRFVKRKNVTNVVKALQILKDEYRIDVRYVLAGDGPEKEHILRKLEASSIAWQYLGRISEREKWENFYPSLDVFALPPLALPGDVEGFGIVYLEANSVGVPVVAADTGGVRDAVCEGVSGLFADPADPHDIARKIHNIITGGHNYAVTARAWADRFSQIKTARQFDEVYMQAGQRS